jgi:cell division septum initiation protein DivIVA
MPNENPKAEKPSYEELEAKLTEQWKCIAELDKIIKQQDAAIAELHAAVDNNRRKTKARANYGMVTAGLGGRVEAILRMAETEVESLLEEGRRQAAEIVARAEEEAGGAELPAELQAGIQMEPRPGTQM